MFEPNFYKDVAAGRHVFFRTAPMIVTARARNTVDILLNTFNGETT